MAEVQRSESAIAATEAQIAVLFVSFAEVANGAFGRSIVPLGNPIVKDRVPSIPNEPGNRAA
jgi:hypothetical protein